MCFVKFLRFLFPPFHFLKFWLCLRLLETLRERREEREAGIWGVCCFVSHWNASWLLTCQDVRARGKELRSVWAEVKGCHCPPLQIGGVVWCHCDHRNKKTPQRCWAWLHQFIKLALLSALHYQLWCKSWCNANTLRKSAKQPCGVFLASERILCYWRQWWFCHPFQEVPLVTV